MKKQFFLHFALFTIFVSLLLHSCRSEDISDNSKQNAKNALKVSVIENNKILKNSNIFKKIDKIRAEKFGSNTVGKSVQDSILEGANIQTENVLLVENGTHKTYTFPVTRNYISNKIENLVLKQNIDSTYTGVLIQYDLTPLEKDLFISGQDVDLKSKTKIFDIDQLNVTSRIQTDLVGCWQITWETGWCSKGIHESGSANVGDCQVGGPSTPQVLAITNICNESGGMGGPTGTTNPNDPNFNTGDNGGYSDYNTVPFTGTFEEYQAHLIELNRVFRLKLNSAQLAWYNSNTALGIELAKLYNEDSSILQLNFLKSLIDYMMVSINPKDILLYANIMAYLKSDGSYDENWTLINNIMVNNNPEVGIFVLKFLTENTDTENKVDIVNRINTLENALVQNPNLLLDIPCNQLPAWQAIAMHQIPQSVKNKINNIPNQNSYWSSWNITDLDDGAGARVNMDLFPVKIHTMPNKPNSNQKYTPAEFFEFYRKNLNLFAEKFIPIEDDFYNIHDTALWNSANPLGALIHIEIPIDDGSVLCSGFSTNTWIFSTIKAPQGWSYDGVHPVSGNRAFSYYLDPIDNSMNIYTRGVDRTSKYNDKKTSIINALMEQGSFYGADQLWTGMQTKLAKYINDRGGSAIEVQSEKYRPNYLKVKNYLKNKTPLSSLGCN